MGFLRWGARRGASAKIPMAGRARCKRGLPKAARCGGGATSGGCGGGWRWAASLPSAAMEVPHRQDGWFSQLLRAAPLVGWQAGCAVALAYLLSQLDWGGNAGDVVWNMVFGRPLVMLGIAAVLAGWAYWLSVWRRRNAYLRHDGVSLYCGGAHRWPLVLIRDVIVTRSEVGVRSLRLVVDDDSEVTRELVKLYMLDERPEVVRDAVMFAVSRAGCVGAMPSVH